MSHSFQFLKKTPPSKVVKGIANFFSAHADGIVVEMLFVVRHMATWIWVYGTCEKVE